MHQQATIIFPSTERVEPVGVSLTVNNNRFAGNQEILDSNREHFHSQTEWVLEQLMNGRDITWIMALREFNIQDVRARLYTLRKKGFLMSEKKIEKGRGAKAVFMTQAQIKINQPLKAKLIQNKAA